MKNVTLFLLFIFCQFNVPAQTLFAKIFNHGDTSSQQTFQLAADSVHQSFLLLGREKGFQSNAVSEILNLNAGGNLNWAENFTSPDSSQNDPVFYGIAQTSDGWLLSGYYSNNAVLLKLDTAFHQEWIQGFIHNHPSKSFPAIGFQKPLSTNEKFIVTGIYGSGNGRDNRDSLLILSLNKDGSNPEITSLVFHKNQEEKVKIDTPVAVFQDGAKNYLFFTSSGTLDPETAPGKAATPEVTVLNNSFKFLYSQKFVLNYSANLVDAIRLKDGHYLLTGSGYKKFYLMNLDSSLNVSWIKTYNSETIADSNDYISANSVVQITNGFVIAGVKYFPITSNQAAWFMSTDGNGNPIQSNLIAVDTPSAGAVENLLPWNGDSVIIASIIPSGSFNHLLVMNSDLNAETSCGFQSEPLIVLSDSLKTIEPDTPSVSHFTNYSVESVKLNTSNINFTVSDKCNTVTSANTLHEENSELKVFPQPASDMVSILIPGMKAGNKAILSVYNSAGEQVLAQEVETNLFTLSARDFCSGLYLIKLNRGEAIQYSKFIVQH